MLLLYAKVKPGITIMAGIGRNDVSTRNASRSCLLRSQLVRVACHILARTVPVALSGRALTNRCNLNEGPLRLILAGEAVLPVAVVEGRTTKAVFAHSRERKSFSADGKKACRLTNPSNLTSWPRTNAVPPSPSMKTVKLITTHNT